jgi:hypothetical protein
MLVKLQCEQEPLALLVNCATPLCRVGLHLYVDGVDPAGKNANPGNVVKLIEDFPREACEVLVTVVTPVIPVTKRVATDIST